MPSDHRFVYPEDFYASVRKAISAAEKGYLVTFGVNPTDPKIGYGYIHRGDILSDGIYKVSHFLEKPERVMAEAMLKTGGHYWNSGIFFFKASVYLKELETYTPAIYQAVVSAWNERVQDLSFIRLGNSFNLCPSDSIDYAVLERTDKAAVVPMDGGWNDMGSWEAFYEVSEKDSNDNVCVGSVMTENANNCYLRSSGRLIAAVGISNLSVVETKDAILVADRSSSQDIKKIVDQLKLEKRMEFDSHLLVYRPWGYYETLVLSDRFQVKRIVVKQGQQNSLQMHYHRAEHWTVVSGTAEVTIGDSVKLLTENESIYVPLGIKHRIRNPGNIPLVFIEIQTGAYLGEEDIVRFQDNYGRAEAGEVK